jgi:cysteine-rich repeat protein
LRWWSAPAALVLTLLALLVPWACFEERIIVHRSLCGNGQVDPGEECDDGNADSHDGCSAQCRLEDESEVCDNDTDDDLDGMVDCEDPDCDDDPACPAAEICDNAADDDGDGLVDCDDPDCDTDPACAPMCGDGLVEGAEECDDGNGDDCDLCSNTCRLREHCDNRADDDLDGMVDCADADCQACPPCI